MNDAPIFVAVRKIVRRHSGNPLEGLVQLDVDELNAALTKAREEPIQAGGLGAVLHTGLSDADAFFASLRQSFGGLSQGQVDGINVLLPAMGAAQWPLAFAAYGLATPWLETDKTMQPIHERGGQAYFTRRYDITGNPAKARELGNLSPGDGAKYAGRGYVQLTGKANYRKAEAALGVPLVTNPDLAMKADVAAKILIWGMETGAFTGKKLATYLPHDRPANRAEFGQARRIINGTDRADEIAGMALSFQRALEAGGWS
jgi:putative chitinase